MPRLPDVMNLLAWLAALWWAAATTLVVLDVTHSGVALHWTNTVYLAATAVMSLIAFCAMGWDKRRARLAKRRIPEHVLHMFELLGGWPGSLIGQRTFHHKTRKLMYQSVFWAAVAMHLLLLAWLTYLWWTTPAPSPSTAPIESTEPTAE